MDIACIQACRQKEVEKRVKKFQEGQIAAEWVADFKAKNTELVSLAIFLQ
jgi:hypothetical protein